MTESNKVFTTDIEIRFRDLDSRGHVNNAVYFTYFELGRLRFYQSAFQKDKLDEIPFILAHTSCDFIKPLTLYDQITIQVWINEIGHKSFTFRYKLINRFDSSVVYATGVSVQVCFDYRKNVSVPVSDELKTQLAGYLIS